MLLLYCINNILNYCGFFYCYALLTRVTITVFSTIVCKGIYMLYRNEEDFIEKILAKLKLKNVESFPYDNQEFYAGIERMKLVFEENIDSFGDAAEDLSLLFVKNPYQGVYSRFREGISSFNGDLVSFVNPEYECCIVNMSTVDANYLVNNDASLPIDEDILDQLVDAFCNNMHNLVLAA